MPFGDNAYRAVRDRAGFVDRSARGKIAVSGQDRASYLQGLLTNDIAALRPGTGCYAAYLTPQGRMIADMRVLELGDVILLDVDPSLTTMLVARFEDLVFTEDVQVADWTERWALVAVHGPDAAAMVADVFARSSAGNEPFPAAEQLAKFATYENRRWAFGPDAAVVVRVDDYAVAGFEIYLPPQSAVRFRSELEAAGVPEVGSATAETLRVEAGRPAFGIDLDAETIPLEAGIEDRAISFTKGCYVGQELIVRIVHRGHGRVVRKLVALTFDTPVASPEELDRVAARGDALVGEGYEAGRITSVAFSPALGRAIALGYVPRALAEIGTKVVIDRAGARSSAVVTQPPFVRSWGQFSR